MVAEIVVAVLCAAVVFCVYMAVVTGLGWVDEEQ